MLLEKDGEEQPDQPCEKRKSIKHCQEGQEYPTYSKEKESKKKKKRDKSQLILPFIGFGYMFRNKSILHQALIQDKQQV